MQRKRPKIVTLKDGRYIAKCREGSALRAVLNGHSAVWPEAQMVVSGNTARFYKSRQLIWFCNAQYAAHHFDVILCKEEGVQ